MSQIEIENLLKRTMGLDAASVGSAAIARAVHLRMSRCNLKRVEEYWEQIRGSHEELQELIEAVVVPETWFFRNQEAFTALVFVTMNEWLPTHVTGVLRVLSLPCSTGEEPYSIVMALLEGGLLQNRLQVDAVDISARALSQARRAEYGGHSFRSPVGSLRARYFRPVANAYHLAEPIREQVQFQQGNILAPGFQVGMEPYDVIFCRNLLIYLDRPTQERVLKTLDRLLAPTGIIFFGPAEAILAVGNGFRATSHPRAFACRKTVPPCALPALGPHPSARAIHGEKSRPAKPEPAPRVTPGFHVEMDGAPAPVASVLPAADLESARRLADMGRLLEAAQQCEAHLRAQGASAPAYYLLGLVRDALGDAQRAGESYRKALYLEPDHAEVLQHLAFLAKKRGDALGAQRLQARALRVESRVRGCGP